MRLRFKGTIQGCRDTLEYLVSSFWANSLLRPYHFLFTVPFLSINKAEKEKKTSGDVRLDISDIPDKRALHY